MIGPRSNADACVRRGKREEFVHVCGRECMGAYVGVNNQVDAHMDTDQQLKHRQTDRQTDRHQQHTQTQTQTQTHTSRQDSLSHDL